MPPLGTASPGATPTPDGVVIDKSKSLLLSRTGMNSGAFDVQLLSDAPLIVSFLCEGSGRGEVTVDHASNAVQCGTGALTSQFQVTRPVAHLQIQAHGRWEVSVQQER